MDHQLSCDPQHHLPLCLQCDFLKDEAPTPQVFSSGSLQVAAGDLKQLMATFHHVYETELRVYCNREPPSFSSDTQVFQRVHRLLLALNTVRTRARPSSAAPPSALHNNVWAAASLTGHVLLLLSGTRTSGGSNRCCFCVHEHRRQPVPTSNTAAGPTVGTEGHIPYVGEFSHQENKLANATC